MESTEKLIEQDVSQENSKDYLVNFDTIPLKDNEYINQEKQKSKTSSSPNTPGTPIGSNMYPPRPFSTHISVLKSYMDYELSTLNSKIDLFSENLNKVLKVIETVVDSNNTLKKSIDFLQEEITSKNDLI